MTQLLIIVVAADPLVRAGLVRLVETENSQVITELASLEHLPFSGANVILWDGSGEPPSEPLTLPLLVLVPGEATPADYLDAQGILYRDSSSERIVTALYALSLGLTVFEPAFTVRPSKSSDDIPTDVTARELEVLQLLAEGLANKAIAKRLEISENTVKFHVNALLEKFGVGSRTEVVIKAIQNGLVRI